MDGFFVKGKPVPQGSTRAFNNHIVHTNAKTLKPWRDTIKIYARQAQVKVSNEPVHLSLDFYLLKPKTVKREAPAVKPDLDKLIRAVLDALTGTAYIDDAQVISIRASKQYGEREGVLILIEN